ncbi:MAG TPA: hypothetical protein PJ997_00625 [Candidatus Paceibacterota bacterium]|nr:hypothetical protein [Candidatus Paceibacterota bacterium]HMP18830.1 hypothetical protein [Candidatus Paceibacterota bacterium]HMP85554.1 hypothetical protein [Candidatus Paceibacterota bacterium]
MKQIIKTGFLTTILLPTITFGQTLNSGLNDPIGVSNMGVLINRILDVVVTVGTVIVVLAIIYAGFLFIAARGNPEKINQAKSVFLWTVIGAIVLLGAQLLSNIIVSTARGLGVNI